MEPKKEIMMEEMMRSISMAVFVIGLCGVLLKWVWIGFEWVWLRPKKMEKCLRDQGFAGNSYRVLVGDLRDSNKMDREAHSKPLNLDADICSRVMPFTYHTLQKYGKNCFTWLGPYMNVVLMDPELIREMLNKHEAWVKPLDLLPQAKDLVSGLVRLEGQKWVKHRRFLHQIFYTENLKSMFPAIYLSCKKMLKKWETMALPTGSVEFDSWPYCHDLSKEILARAVFGNNNYKDGLKIFQVQQEYANLGLQALRSIYIPGYQYLPTKFNKKLRGHKREIQQKLKEKIEEKEKEIAEVGDKTNNDNDLMSFMLVSNSKLIKEKGKECGLSLDELVDDCEQFYEAGESGTSSLLVWTLVLLSQHQDWQDKARDEILQVFGNKEPDFDGLSRLKIVTMILNEVLRLYSPAYLTMRSSKQDMKLGNLFIPAGVLITIPILLVHHDPDLWGNDVTEFNPQRFGDGVKTATKGRLSFLPFLTGPRTCLGYQLVMIKGKFLVASLLQRFSLQLSPAYTHTPFPVKTLLPQHEARIIIRSL